MDWQKILKESQEKQPINLKLFIDDCCKNLGVEADEVIYCLLSATNNQDIINGHISKEIVKNHIQLWIESGKKHISGKTQKPDSLILKDYMQESETINMAKCEYCTSNTGHSNRCKSRELVFSDKWQRCKHYRFSGQYKAVQEAQTISDGGVPGYYCKQDKVWLSSQWLSTRQCASYSDVYLKQGRQAANLSILE